MLTEKQMALVARQLDSVSVFAGSNPNTREVSDEVKQTVFVQMCHYAPADGREIDDILLADTVRSKIRTETTRAAERYRTQSAISQLPEHYEPTIESDPVAYSQPSATEIAAMREWCDVHSQQLEDAPTMLAQLRTEIQNRSDFATQYRSALVDIATAHYARTGTYVDPRELAEALPQLLAETV